MGTELDGMTLDASHSEKKMGILFELEYCAIDGRKIEFDVMSSVLSDRSVKITPALFSQHCVSPDYARSLSTVLEIAGKARVSADKAAKEMAKGVRLSLADGTVKIKPGMASLLTRAREKEISLGAVTALGSDSAQHLSERLGLADMGVLLHCYDVGGQSGGPDADAWRKLVKSMSVSRGRSLAFASSREACRGALFSGLRCAAVPDAYTGYQDFSGADFVFDELTADVIDELLDLVEV